MPQARARDDSESVGTILTPRLRIKRAYAPAHGDDGARVLVDRLWPRGLRKQDAALTLWLKDIAPTTGLRTWFGHEAARFLEFSHRYRAELANCPSAIALLLDLMRQGHLTLVYGARDPQCNHARVLAEHLDACWRRGSHDPDAA